MTDVNILKGLKKGFEQTRDDVQEKINVINQEIDKEIEEKNAITK